MIGDYDRLKIELFFVALFYIIFLPIIIPIVIYYAIYHTLTNKNKTNIHPDMPFEPIVETEEQKTQREAQAAKFKFYKKEI
jgi:hypothetical protein